MWPHIRAYIAKALAREGSGRFLPNDVLRILLDGRARLWVAWNTQTNSADAAVVTEILQYPQLREGRIWLVGGRNLQVWAKGEGWAHEGRLMVEAFFRAQGCVLAAGALRRGWCRIAGDGWKETGVMLEKKL